MPLTINGVVHENGAPLLVGGAQADQMTVNGVQVWVNNYVADAPTGFTASDGLFDVINFTWALPADQGVPTCTYQVRDAQNVVRASAAAGATSASWSNGIAYSNTFHVIGVNIAGNSANSNTDAGSSKHFNASWSGSSSTTTDGVGTVQLTISTSGSSHRAQAIQYSNPQYGGWIATSASGTIANGTTATDKCRIVSSSNNFTPGWNYGGWTNGTAANFTASGGFTGAGGTAPWSFQTSGGSIRSTLNGGSPGAWITLT